MEFSWSTFFIEIVNFIVLMWLLTRLLYQPILKTIAARKQAIQDQLDRAAQLKTEGEQLAKRYEARLADWEKEKAAFKTAFERELTQERTRRETELQGILSRQ